MTTAHALIDSTASLKPTLVRRTYPATVMPRRRFGTAAPLAAHALAEHSDAQWGADLRFFVICYLAGFSFFLIMLS